MNENSKNNMKDNTPNKELKPLKKITIYGERCSGTNYLEELLVKNFDIEIVWSYGWKHFFGFSDLTNSEDVLFIGIVRNIHDWMNSFYKIPHHLPPSLIKSVDTFLNNEFYSIDNNNNEMMNDRNIETKERYKNIFEMRHIKNKFLVQTMPNLVKNYLLITYENLIDDFIGVMNQIKNCGLKVKEEIEFPENIFYYQKHRNMPFVKEKYNTIEDKIIMEKANLFYEKILFPNLHLFSIQNADKVGGIELEK